MNRQWKKLIKDVCDGRVGHGTLKARMVLVLSALAEEFPKHPPRTMLCTRTACHLAWPIADAARISLNVSPRNNKPVTIIVVATRGWPPELSQLLERMAHVVHEARHG